MTRGGAGPFQFKKHIPPKRVYRKYKIWKIDTGTIKARVFKKKMGHNLPEIRPIPPKETSS
jgi:hypothetical protein